MVAAKSLYYAAASGIRSGRRLGASVGASVGAVLRRLSSITIIARVTTAAALQSLGAVSRLNEFCMLLFQVRIFDREFRAQQPDTAPYQPVDRSKSNPSNISANLRRW
jgi:hypothetical protein